LEGDDKKPAWAADLAEERANDRLLVSLRGKEARAPRIARSSRIEMGQATEKYQHLKHFGNASSVRTLLRSRDRQA